MVREDFVSVLVTDSHQTAIRAHETHGLKTTSGEEEGKAKVKGTAFVYKWWLSSWRLQ